MESLLAFLLLLVGGMFSASTPPPGPLEKIFQYIDLHQDEFVQVRGLTCTKLSVHFGKLGELAGRCGFFFFFFFPDNLLFSH